MASKSCSLNSVKSASSKSLAFRLTWSNLITMNSIWRQLNLNLFSPERLIESARLYRMENVEKLLDAVVSNVLCVWFYLLPVQWSSEGKKAHILCSFPSKNDRSLLPSCQSFCLVRSPPFQPSFSGSRTFVPLSITA